jgi:hypothetical protein
METGAGGIVDRACERVPAVYVESWAAMRLDAVDGTARRFGSCAEDSIIPAAHRRRLGPYGRMAVTCGLSIAAADSSDLVFSSQYGDVDLAHKLLTELVAGGLLSPAAFSLSVHNAAPGVMDLVRKSRVGHTAIAAGTQSLSAGLAEAWAKLAEKPQVKIAFVYTDYALPDVYREFSDMKLAGTALALSLSTQCSEASCGQFELETEDKAGALDSPYSEDLAGLLISALDGTGGSIRWRSRGLRWSLKASSDEAG